MKEILQHTDKNSNKRIIGHIQAYLSEDVKMLDFLSDTLDMTRESVYRRTRGAIAFTFQEIVKIASALGISIDYLIAKNIYKEGVYEFSLDDSVGTPEMYWQRLRGVIDFYSEISQFDNTYAIFAWNDVDFLFTIFKETLHSFVYYRWLHQFGDMDIDFRFSELNIPEYGKELRNSYLSMLGGQGKTVVIFDKDLFRPICKDIQYFYQLGLVSDQELHDLRNELEYRIDAIEVNLKTARTTTGNTTMLYLSDIPIDGKYSYYEYGDKKYCQTEVYGVHFIQSDSDIACMEQKRWLDALLRSSVSITQSNRVQSYDFLMRQRKFVESITSKIFY